MLKNWLLLCSLLISCTSIGTKNNDISEDSSFSAFIKKFKKCPIPFTIKACKVSMDGLSTFDFDGKDSLYVSQGRVPYCTFIANGNYVAVISLGEADCLLPILTTYDKEGKKIDEKIIGIGYCGVGPGFTCEEFMTLRKDYTLYTSDTVSMVELDSLGNEVKGTEERYVVYKKGKLLSSGEIELSNEIKEDLKK